MPGYTALLLLAAAASITTGYKYDPGDRTDPFDVAAKQVSEWLKDSSLLQRRDDGWESHFCDCIQNGYISSWYQYASMMYLVDSCSPQDGLVLRTGHLQMRHTQPLQNAMSCDTLKLITYCFNHHAEEALPKWNQTCRSAHYTVAACDVDCNAAVPRAGGRGGVMAALTLAGAMAAMVLLAAN
eukprot:CAMPEP_0179116450 /NCGR_PEP_ID=MMETSP0796-20121207/54624_1 /TAXON_ID=73915 /ORGANISM="Pyrodinium bahamense, Strain pbaha01" /LENGTH=182 /DNA_ID=CAMNT_0020814737 /DNA_START=86 /DNA_END=634 /DNA_ORIENTATION=-